MKNALIASLTLTVLAGAAYVFATKTLAKAIDPKNTDDDWFSHLESDTWLKNIWN